MQIRKTNFRLPQISTQTAEKPAKRYRNQFLVTRESLPKQQKIGEKVEIPVSGVPQISTKTAKN
ncbi:MAG TPA: hypothetical protein DCX93_00380 [Butyrivibrio sp.]|nr:hypothetical protein [Butyrivibrio sp.]